MAESFATVPSGVLKAPEKFTLRVPDQDLEDFKQLLTLSKIGPETYWNKQEDRSFGITRKWLSDAKEAWLKYDWRKLEARVNALPNFKATVDANKETGPLDIHFVALFSAREDAVPVIFMHGWPGSFLEFLPMLDLLVAKHTPATLPYHVVVPSIPGYGLSAHATSTDREMTLLDAAGAMNQLMVDLGFGAGYAAQGGDVGSILARSMSYNFEECRALHLNLLVPEGTGSKEALTTEEIERLHEAGLWRVRSMTYAHMHGLRQATIGLVLSASPLSLLAWIGEKYLDWVDPRYPLELDTILDQVSLYWLTSTFPRSLYPYRPVADSLVSGKLHSMPIPKDIPLGCSDFRYEMFFTPKAWAEEQYPSLKLYRSHDKGGHFAALEQPEVFLQDVEDFLQLEAGHIRNQG